jgi:hypothetical protein
VATAGERSAAAEVIAKAKARTARVALMLDGDLLAEHERLTVQFERATDADKGAIAARIVDLEGAIADAEIEFVFRGLGRGQWRKLMADHPPTDEDKARGLDFNGATFPLVAMAATLIAPEFTLDELEELADDVLTVLDFERLWAGCLKANVGSGVTRPESRAAHAFMANGRPNSPQPSTSESPEAS